MSEHLEPQRKRARRASATLPDPWRIELTRRVESDGLRATARALDVGSDTIYRALRGAPMNRATVRAILGALALQPSTAARAA